MNDHERLNQIRAIAAGAGKSEEHLRFVLDLYDRRTTELLAANSVLVEERRSQALRAEDAERNVAFLLSHNGIRQLAELEDERLALLNENEVLRAQRDKAEQNQFQNEFHGDAEITSLAREWGRAIHNLEQSRIHSLEQSRKKDDEKKGGESVYKANQAYTKAHLALKTALKAATTSE